VGKFVSWRPGGPAGAEVRGEIVIVDSGSDHTSKIGAETANLDPSAPLHADSFGSDLPRCRWEGQSLSLVWQWVDSGFNFEGVGVPEPSGNAAPRLIRLWVVLFRSTLLPHAFVNYTTRRP
jgi:hypothetical protein